MRESVDKVNRPPRQDPASDEVLELVHTVMHQFRSQLFQALRQGTHELTHMESKVLGFFVRRPGATQSDLVQQTGRDKAQLARLIKGLRERGLLDAVADEADRRNLRLTPTDAGLAIQRALQRQARQLEAQAVTGLDAAEKARLLELLRRVQANLAAGKS
ncbi:MarR family transcriptional regulator [Pseudorhodoferax sp. Leaf267]|nr:MarR family transcriptional regulator [Pseudorhodoferax sp. Leaf267]